MTKKIFLIIGFLSFAEIFAQQVYTVQKGDNLTVIAKKYGISTDELLKKNPKIKGEKIAIGDVLNVPAQKPKPVETQPKPDTTPKSADQKLGKIILQPKQTIYGITKQYRISETDLRKLNPNLDSGMKIGNAIILPLENIKKYGNLPQEAPIPENKTPEKNISETKIPDTKIPDTVSENISDDKMYVVQPKDNYYQITKKFNLTQQQLFAMNPDLEAKGLHPGDKILVKNDNSVVAQTPIQTPNPDDPQTYTVQAGDTAYGITNKFGISLDDLLSLNPQLSGGLKAGMVLKIKNPNAFYAKKSEDVLNVVLLLPFGFDSGEAKYRSFSMDFLAGAKLAIERNAKTGQKLDIKVVDAETETNFKNSITKIDKNNTDLIIGPFFKSNVLDILNYVKTKKIPVVAPFANSEDLFGYGNLIMTQPQNTIFADRIVKEVAQIYSNQKIYIVADADKTNANLISEGLKKSLKNPNIIVVNTPEEMQSDKNMMTGQAAPVIAILASDNTEIGNSFTAKIIALSQETSGMKAFSMFYQPSFDKQEDDLGAANLVYLMDRKINTDGDFEKEIIADYKAKYCATPSKYAVIGFDILNDILSRENKKGEIFKQINKVQTQLATKFEYVRAKNNGAYINTGYRVVRLLQ
jgi:LysM repeat protein